VVFNGTLFHKPASESALRTELGGVWRLYNVSDLVAVAAERTEPPELPCHTTSCACGTTDCLVPLTKCGCCVSCAVSAVLVGDGHFTRHGAEGVAAVLLMRGESLLEGEDAGLAAALGLPCPTEGWQQDRELHEDGTKMMEVLEPLFSNHTQSHTQAQPHAR